MLRKDVPLDQTWDLTALYKDGQEALKSLDDLQNLVKKLSSSKMEDSEEILPYTKDYEQAMVLFDHLVNYEELIVSTDFSDQAMASLGQKIHDGLVAVQEDLALVEGRYYKLEDGVLKDFSQDPVYGAFFKGILRDKPHHLGQKTEALLKSLSPVLDLPYSLYQEAKFKDLTFPDFQVDGKNYPLSFILYEDQYAYDPDTQVRRKSFQVFSQALEKYENTMATGFIAMVKRDLALAKARSYPSVFDYMLRSHEISREMFDDHLDTMMEKLAPIMRTYAGILKDRYGLDTMTYADLKLSPNPQAGKKYSMEEAKDLILKAFAPYGKDYVDSIAKAFSDRWLDYADNDFKSTGGFCASPYQCHSYILMTFRGLLSDVFTLAHELGHAGHFKRAGSKQSILTVEPSLYFVESPSTTSELLLKEYLLKEAKTPEERREIIGQSLANTYYHNFVTHFLEAYFQREVYRRLEAGDQVQGQDLRKIFLETLEKFWGDSVDLPDSAGLTWMRQPHYYEASGFYSYTYSAGLNLGTLLGRLLVDDPSTTQKWLEVLDMGGSQSPIDLAQHVGLDIRTSQALEKTISIIGDMVQELKEVEKNA